MLLIKPWIILQENLLRGSSIGNRDTKTFRKLFDKVKHVDAQYYAESLIMSVTKLEINYPDHLPVSKMIAQIKDLVMRNQVLIVCGETGSGKTTQLPKMLYELGLSYADKLSGNQCIGKQIIGHTQPRRVAAKTIAKRIAEELNDPDIVGCRVRFHDRVKPTTQIKLMTDGILLQEIQHDRYLRKYRALIIDEAHERSLNIDFILGYLKTILHHRPDLKIIITSATIDNEKLSKFFNNAPMVNIEGKTYPVDIIYAPIDEKSLTNNINNGSDSSESGLNFAIYQAIESCLTVDIGNILVFLPGEREIKSCLRFLHRAILNGSYLSEFQLLALYSRQNELEQNLVFRDDASLKIIITTNVAETSLTIPGVKFVIDSGLARVKRYNSRYKIEQLQVENIAQANSQQRTGRAGRLSHGMCIRLFSQAEFDLRNKYPDPEILRSNLANVILKLLSFKLGDPQTFPFLDKPDPVMFNDGFKTLFQLNAIDNNNQVTKIGAKLARLPVDVSLSRMLIAAVNGINGVNCLTEVLIIVAFLAVSDPREVPFEHQQLASQRHAIWVDKTSDFNAILNLWAWYSNELQHKKSNKKFLEHCRYQFLSATKLREWSELHGQLKEAMVSLGYTLIANDPPTPSAANIIHQALLTGMLNNIGQKDLVESYYNGVNGKKFYLHPSSGIDKKNKNLWICAANLTQTTRLYARLNAIIDPEWLVPISRHIVKYTYDSAIWDKKRGEVVAVQSTLLYGLVINKKKVSYSQIDQSMSREIFIRDALVPNDIEPNYAKKYSFLVHNAKVLLQLDKLEDKFRMTTVMVDEELFSFYTKVVPLDVWDIRRFDLWYSGLDSIKVKSLELNYNELVAKFTEVTEHIQLYPDFLINQGNKIKLKYIFDTTRADDGVTAIINLNQLLNINEAVFTWLVAGLIRDKLTYVIKALPKTVRIKLNPLNDFVTQCLTKCLENLELVSKDFSQDASSQNSSVQDKSCQDKSFAKVIASYLQQRYQLKVSADDITQIETTKLPAYLRFHYQILDGTKLVASGDDLTVIKAELSNKLHMLVTNISGEYEVLDIKHWIPVLATLLQEVKLFDNKQKVNGYFSLIYDASQDRVNLIVCNSLDKAKQNTKVGFHYLVRLHMMEQIKYLRQKKWVDFKLTTMYLAGIYSEDGLLQAGINFILYQSINVSKFITDGRFPQTLEEFNQFIIECKNQVGSNLALFGQVLLNFTTVYHQINLRLNKHNTKLSHNIKPTHNAKLINSSTLIKSQLSNLRSLSKSNQQHPLCEKISLQLDDLIFPQFLRYVKWQYLSNYPRYLQAIMVRLDKYELKPERYINLDHEIESLYETWYNHVDKLELQQQFVSQELYDFKYKIEELRVSLFAPHLKTPYAVSVKRLLHQLEELI